MTWPILLRRRGFLPALLGAVLLATTALTFWLVTQSTAEASSSAPPDSGAAGIADAQVDSRADHTCTTSEDTDAGREFQLISEVTVREDLEDVYVEFELINLARGLSGKGTAPEDHQDLKAGESRTFSLNVLLLRQGSNWIVKCTVKANSPTPVLALIVDETVSETKAHEFGVTRGSLTLTGSEAWLNTCEPMGGWENRRFDIGETIYIEANGIAEGHLGEGANQKNKFDVYLRIHGDGEQVSEFNANREATGPHILRFYDDISAPQDAGYYALDCILISKNSHLDLLERIKNVQSCQSGHFIPAIAACMATLSLDVKFLWHPVSIISKTICVGDESDCPETSSGTGTTTTTPPPAEGTTPEPAPVTPILAPAPPPAPAPPSGSDRAALIALYNDTGGVRWINNLQEREIWQVDDSGSDLDDWYQVSTHDRGPAQGRVKYLVLEFDNNLHGTLPSLLGNLTEALVLSIKGNERDGRSLLGVSGSIPGELGNLSELQELYLSNNELTGGIPGALGNLSELDTLDLSDNRLSGNIPAALGNLTLLRDLNLSGNRLEGEIPAALANLTDLESLHLSGGSNSFTGCIPSGLHRVDDHDLDELGIPFCDVALRGLTVSPGQLDEPFDSTQTSFSATVYQSRITVAPAAAESGSFDILDDGGNLIPDADAGTSGHQVDLSSGDETIRVRITSVSGRNSETYTLDLTVEGPSVPGGPTIGAVTAQGASLLVPWSAATGSDASAATSYNLRHIRSDAADKADANWTRSTVSASPGSGGTSYRLQDLEAQTAYDLQLQAVNDAGASPWSASVSAATGAAISISWISCGPSRPLPGATVSCTPSVTGGVRSDDSYAWLAEGGSPSGGSGRTFSTSWDSMGPKRVAVEACSAGDCASSQRTVAVADPNPSIIWYNAEPPAEIALGDSINLWFKIIKLSVPGLPGGISVSFPNLTQRSGTGSVSSYESGQGAVETVSFSGGRSGVTYRDSGSRQGLQNADGTQGTPRHLTVTAETSNWPRSFFFMPTGRTLRLRATPRETGEFRILYRFWLCTSDGQNCAHRPLQDGEDIPATDQQGWAAFELTVNVLAPPVIDSISCTPAPAQASDTVDCSPVLSGSAPSTYAWNAGNALAGGSPYEGTGATFPTTWDFPGRHRVALEVCNVAGCATAEQFVTVRGDTTDAEPDQLPTALAGEDGGRVIYSGPASGKAHPQYTATDTILQIKILPTSPVPTLQVTIYDDDGFAGGSASYVSPGVVVLVLPEDAWVDHVRIATDMYLSGSWTPYTKQTEAVLLAVQSALSAAHLAALTATGLTPAVGMAPGPALTASDHLSLGLGGVSDPPIDEIFGETHANCVSQVTVPWLAWAGETKGVRVSIPLSMSRDAYASLAAAFTAAEPGATGGEEPALAQLHDLLATGDDAPTCQPPGSPAQ